MQQNNGSFSPPAFNENYNYYYYDGNQRQFGNINNPIPYNNQNYYPQFSQNHNQTEFLNAYTASISNFDNVFFSDIDGRRSVRISDILPGYRFRPTPQELIKEYLIPKNKNALSPHFQLLIPEADVYNQSPEKLIPADERKRLDELQKEWYFMTIRNRKYPNGSRPARTAGGGYWKLSGKEKPVNDQNGKQIGAYSVLDYLIGKHPTGVKTGWKMYEYVVKEPNTKLKVENWIICKIYEFKRESKKNKTNETQAEPQPTKNTMGTEQRLNDVPEVSNHAENVQRDQSSIQDFAATPSVLTPLPYCSPDLMDYFPYTNDDFGCFGGD